MVLREIDAYQAEAGARIVQWFKKLTPLTVSSVCRLSLFVNVIQQSGKKQQGLFSHSTEGQLVYRD